jgi:Protein of unknown function (DUF541)
MRPGVSLLADVHRAHTWRPTSLMRLCSRATRSCQEFEYCPVWSTQVRACIGESRLPVAPHWPRGVHGAVTDQNSVSSGERSDRVGPSSSAARDAAIAEAVADATDQAQAAADAAGIHLGAVPDLHVSAMAVVYPIEGTVSPNSGIAVGSTGSSGAGSEPWGDRCWRHPDRYLGSATVTITWAISWRNRAGRLSWLARHRRPGCRPPYNAGR